MLENMYDTVKDNAYIQGWKTQVLYDFKTKDNDEKSPYNFSINSAFRYTLFLIRIQLIRILRLKIAEN